MVTLAKPFSANQGLAGVLGKDATGAVHRTSHEVRTAGLEERVQALVNVVQVQQGQIEALVEAHIGPEKVEKAKPNVSLKKITLTALRVLGLPVTVPAMFAVFMVSLILIGLPLHIAKNIEERNNRKLGVENHTWRDRDARFDAMLTQTLPSILFGVKTQA